MDPLFGSETRARVLEQLATSPGPQSAYRIAKAVGAEPTQVIAILRRLTDLAEHSTQGWALVDDDLRRFVRSRIARREHEIRREKNELLIRFGLKPQGGHERA
jgi:hypothetical protein